MRVCSCRFHSSKDLLEYIHALTNPTGVISFEGDDDLAQVVVMPRTVRSFKAKAFSHSYQLNHAMGNYSGIDTIDLTDQLDHGNERSHVSFSRDLLAMNQRADVRSFICTLPKKDRQVTKDLVNTLLEESDRMFEDREKQIAEHKIGATYVPLEDAFELQMQMKHEGSRSIICTDSESGRIHSVNFVPKWPRRIIRIMPAGSKYGSRFLGYCGGFGKREVIFWFVLNVTHFVPELWRTMDSTLERDTDWEGWILTFIVTKIIPHKAMETNKNNPFHSRQLTVLTICKMLYEQMVPAEEIAALFKSMTNLFRRNPFVEVVNTSRVTIDDKIEVIIVVYDEYDRNHLRLSDSLFQEFELRVIGCGSVAGEGRIFVRHGKNFGFQEVGQKEGFRCNCAGSTVSILDQCGRDWQYIVYVRRADRNYKTMKEALLELQGGQSKNICDRHEYPLIASPRFKHGSHLCCFNACRRKIYMRCPAYSCVVGICKKDFEMLLQDSRQCIKVRYDEGSLSNLDIADQLLVEEENNSESDQDEDVDDRSWNHLIYHPSDEDDGDESMYVPSDEEKEDDELWEGDIEVIEDPGIDVADENYEDLESYSIPITNSGRKRMNFDGAHTRLAREGKSIGNHVLLNFQGSLLLRHNRKLYPTMANRHFLQRFMATYEGDGCPLVYPEANLFPSFFWAEEPDLSTVGAIPSTLLQDNVTLNNLGVASLYDHCRTRLLDPTLLSSTNPNYLSYIWDKMANLGLRGSAAEVVLRRGFAEMTGYEGLRMKDADQPVYDSFAIDSRATVNQLAAANARHACELFFTFTCNQKETLAVSRIWDWVESDEAIESIIGIDTMNLSSELRSDEKEMLLAREALRISAGIMVVRTWMETVRMFLQYIQFGKDSPFRNICGGIEDIWARLEIQNDEDGKVPHCHATLYFKNPPTTEKELLPLLELIRTCIETFATLEEQQELIDKGFISCPDGMIAFLQAMENKLMHWCTTRCTVQTRIVGFDGSITVRKERKCKQPDYRRMSVNPMVHTFMNVNITHSQEALHALTILGMIEDGHDHQVSGFIGKCIPKAEFRHLLEAKRHLPPCYAVDRLYSPANPFLFAMLLSAMNLQYCTAYILLRYLAKYIGSVDKSTRIIFKASKNEENEQNVRVTVEQGFNSKITGNKIAQKEKDKKNPNSQFEFHGRVISMAEQTMQLLSYGCIITSLQFEFIPTQPMAIRPVIKKSARIKHYQKQGIVGEEAYTPSDLNAGKVFPGYILRNELLFCEGRQFDNFQVVSYLDSVFQPGSFDAVAIAGLRPPELRFVSRLPKYLTLFVRTLIPGYNTKSKSCEDQIDLLRPYLHIELSKCMWVDGLGHQDKIRRAGVSIILNVLKNIPAKYTKQDFGSIEQRIATERLFQELNEWCTSSNEFLETRIQINIRQEQRQLAQRFLVEGENNVSNKLPIYWFRTVKATESDNFLYHLLLSLGSFVSELELLSQGSLLQSFIHARLFTDSEDTMIQKESVNRLITKYASSQLVHLPAGTQTFDQQLATAMRVIQNLLLQNTIVSDDLPSALFTRIRDQCEDDVEKFCKQRKDSLTKSLHRQLLQIFPTLLSLEAIEEGTFNCPASFDLINLPRPTEQGIESFAEHQKARDSVQKTVAHYKIASPERTKSIAFVGAGGVGKTVEMLLAGLYCRAQGLFVITTSLAGKRSAENNGEHLHLTFHLPINETFTPVQAAEKAVVQLLRDPKRLQLLQRTDVILLDELGPLGAQLLAILDMICRRIRISSHWFGGILTITTVDHKQLKPINGLSPFLCPSILSSFVFHRFNITLRTHNAALQRLQAISRIPADQLNNNIKKEFSELLRKNCSQVDNLDSADIPTNAIYCFARHKLCKKAQEKILKRVREKYRGINTSRQAVDWEETRLQSHAVLATTTTSEALDKEAKPPRQLIFYPYAAYELTFNDIHGRFFQSQLCMLLEKVPTQEQLDRFDDIILYRAPPGIDDLPEIPVSKTNLLKAGWMEIQVGKHPDRKYSLGNYGLCGSRDQYGLKHRISLTIHAIMGSTVPILVTKLGLSEEMKLWEAAQVIVLLSRTRFPQDIWFIGPWEVTIQVLWNALLCTDQFSLYVSHLLDTLCQDITSSPRVFIIDQVHWHPFRPCDMELPGPNEYCCYILASRRQTNVTYVGYTSNMRRRYDEHNSKAGGSASTRRLNLKPWGLLAYVVGFYSKHDAMVFEAKWKIQIEAEQHHGCMVSTMVREYIAEQIISLWSHPTELRLVLCGEV